MLCSMYLMTLNLYSSAGTVTLLFTKVSILFRYISDSSYFELLVDSTFFLVLVVLLLEC